MIGPADALALLLWGRIGLDDPRLNVTGDRSAAAAVLAAGIVPWDRAGLTVRPLRRTDPAPAGISGFSARALICCTAQVLPSGSLKPKKVPPSRSSKTEISPASLPG